MFNTCAVVRENASALTSVGVMLALPFTTLIVRGPGCRGAQRGNLRRRVAHAHLEQQRPHVRRVVSLDRQNAGRRGEVVLGTQQRGRAVIRRYADILEDVGAQKKTLLVGKRTERLSPGWIKPAASAAVLKLLTKSMVGRATASLPRAARRNSTCASSSVAMLVAYSRIAGVLNGTAAPPVTSPLLPGPSIWSEGIPCR
jgi:hypothetical protein